MKILTLSFIASLLASIAYAQVQSMGTVEYNLAGTNYTSAALVATPGIFVADEPSETISQQCIKSGTSWLVAGGGNCSTQNPTAAQQTITTPAPPVGFSVQIENFGITNTQYATAQTEANDGVTPNTDVIKMIGKSMSLGVVGSEYQYTFDSTQLPSSMLGLIPGSGIFMHYEDVLPFQPYEFPFNNGGYLQVLARVGFPAFNLVNTSGNSSTPPTNIITCGITFQGYNTAGALQPISLLIGIYNSKGFYTEYVGSDGRNTYISSFVGPTATFLTANSVQEVNPPTVSDLQVSFQITAFNMMALLTALNTSLASSGGTLFNLDLTQVRLHQIDLRNESSFLTDGVLQFTMNIGYLKSYIVVPQNRNTSPMGGQ